MNPLAGLGVICAVLSIGFFIIAFFDSAPTREANRQWEATKIVAAQVVPALETVEAMYDRSLSKVYDTHAFVSVFSRNPDVLKVTIPVNGNYSIADQTGTMLFDGYFNRGQEFKIYMGMVDGVIIRKTKEQDK